MPTVRLIHWKAAEAAERIDRLEAAGYQVIFTELDSPSALRALTRETPAAVVIDLTRMPSQGRDVGLFLRKSRTTRHLPLVFVEGDSRRVDRIRKLLPDATYTSWSRIRSSLKKAIASPPQRPVVPDSLLAGYAGTPLPRKLGIKIGTRVALIGAPPGFAGSLGELPEGVVLRRQARAGCDLIVWFTRSRRELERRLSKLAATLADRGGLWVAWPKQASGVPTDLTPAVVREVGLASGLVDYKICSIDATWSGLKFTRRKG